MLHAEAHAEARNLILIIGDGMGPQQVGLALEYGRYGNNKQSVKAFSDFIGSSISGLHLPSTKSTLTNDSACAATMLATGCDCLPGEVGVSKPTSECRSVIEIFKKKGKRVGLISDTRITHATPAAFFARVKHRSQEHEIADQVLQEKNVDLFFSGGLSYFVDGKGAQVFDKRCGFVTEGRRSSDGIASYLRRGGNVICNRAELLSEFKLPVLGLFAANDMHHGFEEGLGTEPSLAELAGRALRSLENEAGFFLMIESGQIDWAGHAHDAAWLLREMQRISSVIQVVSEYQQKHADTLIVMTADHETGGFGFAYSSNQDRESEKSFIGHDVLSVFDRREQPLARIADHLVQTAQRTVDHRTLSGELVKALGFEPSEEERKRLLVLIKKNSEVAIEGDVRQRIKSLAPVTELLTEISDKRTGVVWSTPNHTNTPVLVVAQGPGAERFSGFRGLSSLGVIIKSTL